MDDSTYGSADEFTPYHYHEEQRHQHHHTQHTSHSNERNAAHHPQVLVIEAPPGWLGVVIDTPEDMGPPIVYEIMENSPIASQIRLGDQLISVDEVDVDRMTASQVSRIIADRSNNPLRRLCVVRHGSTGIGRNAIV